MTKNRARKSNEIPVTVVLLFQVRDQLTKKVDSDVRRIEANVDGIRRDVKDLSKKVDLFFSKIQNVLARQSVDNREQDARSLYVLDSYNILEARVSRIEGKLWDHES